MRMSVRGDLWVPRVDNRSVFGEVLTALRRGEAIGAKPGRRSRTVLEGGRLLERSRRSALQEIRSNCRSAGRAHASGAEPVAARPAPRVPTSEPLLEREDVVDVLAGAGEEPVLLE